MKNTKKNTRGGTSGKGFDVLGQPSPEAKSKGWERRREAQQIMDMIMRLKNMTWKEITDLQEDVQRHPEKHTVLEVKMAQYLSSSRFTIDFLDRHISKAPIETDITSKGEKIDSIVVTIVKPDGN